MKSTLLKVDFMELFLFFKLTTNVLFFNILVKNDYNQYFRISHSSILFFNSLICLLTSF